MFLLTHYLEWKCRYSRCQGNRAKTKPSTSFAHANRNWFEDKIQNQFGQMECGLSNSFLETVLLVLASVLWFRTFLWHCVVFQPIFFTNWATTFTPKSINKSPLCAIFTFQVIIHKISHLSASFQNLLSHTTFVSTSDSGKCSEGWMPNLLIIIIIIIIINVKRNIAMLGESIGTGRRGR